ncbi:MAG TPA: aminoglycoside phosphotransferase family protein [Anaerolineaceae bacterium]|nr:aminoglycoside phosphotransferase family protein [Anaerolineaceae bacterium]
MNPFRSLLHLLPYRTRRFSRKLLARLKNLYNEPTQPMIWVYGLPEGIQITRLNQICREQFGAPVKRARHYHLSGWKEAGAYRMKILLENGKEQHLVFKNAVYNDAQIPALSGFPILPGLPEFEIYQKGRVALQDLLPKIYDIEEVVSKRQYRYIFENLWENYHILNSPEWKLRFVEHLPRVHQALANLTDSIDPNNVLRFDREFSSALEKYALENLNRYAQTHESADLCRLFEMWPRLHEMHLRDEVDALQPPVLIHGDLNFSNAFFHRSDRSRIRLVDWEWAGYGFPHADLAALLKGTAPEIEEEALRIYAMNYPQISPADHQRIYSWCMLERSLNDAAFLAAQVIDSDHAAKIDLPGTIEKSIRRMLALLDRMEDPVMRG